MPSIAAIDLGSNAMRVCIANKTCDGLEVLKNIRLPLRLGEDVFATGLISDEKMNLTEDAFVQLLEVFSQYNVTNISAKATSAMRDAKNGQELVNRVHHSTGILIETISGEEEARMIVSAVKSQFNLWQKTALIMDIGGGSTELIVVNGDLIIGVESFDVGTVRLLQYKSQFDLQRSIKSQVKRMHQFIAKLIECNKLDLFIGTGGNLRRIGKIRKRILAQPSSQLALFQEMQQLEEMISLMPLEERMNKLDLDQNRADVLLPAILLTKNLMQEFQMDLIQLPKVGLKEGILLSMLDGPPSEFILKD